MRIIVWGINYAPEQTGIGPCNTALCEYLAGRGHEVEMVTSFEYYPTWKKRPEDRWRLYQTEERSGVQIRRCWLYVPRVASALKRMLHELSFVVFSFGRILLLRAPDVFVVVSPPLLLGAAAACVSFIKQAPFVFHIQDLQPDAAIALEMLKARSVVARVLFGLEGFIYRTAARVSTISPGMLGLIQGKGALKNTPIYFPNGMRRPERLPARGAFRERHGISKEAFILLYSGNLGVKQGLGTLLDAAPLLNKSEHLEEDVDFQLVIAGAGAKQASLLAHLKNGAAGNVLFLPLQPEQWYHEMLVDADCCVVSQRAGTGQLFFPSKLLSTLAFGKPVLGLADPQGDLAQAIEEGNFGLAVAPDNPVAVAEAARKMASSPGILKQMGERGSAYVARFEMEKVLEEFEAKLGTLAQASP